MFENHKKEIEKALLAYFNLKEPKNLYAPIQYLLQIGGKRIRPILLFLSAELYGKIDENSIKAAMAIECFHTYTLMHDDVMDKAELRRNFATVHKKYGLNAAILSGDTLFIESYKMMQDINSDKKPLALDLFNQLAMDVSYGQQFDIDFETQKEVSLAEYISMIEKKTAVLLGGSLAMGALIKNAPKEEVDALYLFGCYLGLAFQLQDDYLDAFGTESLLGKTIGGDVNENKKTVLYIKAKEMASPTQKDQIEFWYGQNIVSEEKRTTITSLFYALEVDKKTNELILEYTQKALEQLNKIPKETSNLKSITNQLMQRNY